MSSIRSLIRIRAGFLSMAFIWCMVPVTASLADDVRGGTTPPVCEGFNFSSRNVMSMHDPIHVPDNDLDGTTNGTIEITSPGIIADVNVTINAIDALDTGDLDLYLISPAGTQVELVTDRMSSLGIDMRDVRFDDEQGASILPIGSAAAPYTGTWLAEDPFGLARVDGEQAQGTWKLLVIDDSGSESFGATLVRWSLDINATFSGPESFAGTATDTDGGIQSIVLTGGDNVQLHVSPDFTPGSQVADYSVTLVDPSTNGSAIVTVTDLSSNICQSVIALTGLPDNMPPVNSGEVTRNLSFKQEVQSDVPPGDPSGVTSAINIPDSVVVGEVEVGITVDATDQGRIAATLTHGGEFASLVNRIGMDDRQSVGNTKASFDILLDDDAPESQDIHLESPTGTLATVGTYQPDGRGAFIGDGITVDDRDHMLSRLAGLDSTGVWEVFVGDFRAQGSANNRFRRWSLTLKSPCGPERFVGTAKDPAPGTGVQSIALEPGAVNLQVLADFLPGDEVVEYLVELIDDSMPGAGMLEIVDVAGNVTSSFINLAASTGDGSAPTVSGDVNPATFQFEGVAGDDQPGDTGVSAIELAPHSDNLQIVSTSALPAPTATFTIGLIDPLANGRGYVRVTDGCGLRAHVLVDIDRLDPVCTGDVGTTMRYFSGPIAAPIPDNNAAGVESSILVKDPNLIADVNLTFNITHGFDDDIDLSFTSPVVLGLISDLGSLGNDFIDTTLDDEAAGPPPDSSSAAPFTGAFQPEDGSLSVFDGNPANGTYTLKVVDDKSNDFGTLDSWSLVIESDTFPERYDGRAEDSRSHDAGVCSVDLDGGSVNLVLTVDPAFSPGDAIVRYSVELADPGEPGDGNAIVTDCAGNSVTVPISLSPGSAEICIPPGDDCWATACGTSRVSFADTPIPADFFDPGSQPFTGEIPLGGADADAADTVLQRLAPLCFPLDESLLPAMATSPIELVELDLIACAPVFVQGSQGNGLWDMRVSLSGSQPQGTIDVTKNDASGGTFSASFSVQPVYTFTRQDPPHDVRVFDTALEGIPPAIFQTAGTPAWSTDESFEECSPDGFAAGVTQRFGETCCEETCHSSFGTAPHEHCTSPPGCPQCPTDLGACCLPTGECLDGLTEANCDAMGGQSLGSESTCAVTAGRDVPAPLPAGDYNGDYCVDISDFQAFASCLAGPGTPVPAGSGVADCRRGDFDTDTDLDLRDFAGLQRAFDPRCPAQVPVGTDCWTTPCNEGETIFDCCSNPIPPGFFTPGSLAFTGTIRLGSAVPGSPDTRMDRLAPMVFPTLCSQAQTPIELVQLDLASCTPITVEDEMGPPSLWDVQLALSTTPVPQGMLTATKTHDNGGVFSSYFNVQPVFIFTNVDNGTVRVFDTGLEGYDAFLLETTVAAPWVNELAPDNPATVCGTNFVPGVEGEPGRAAQCCRLVGHAGPGHLHQTAPPDCSGCPMGACCDPNTGACFIALDQSDCTAQGGQYKGDGTNCNDSDGDRIPDVFENNRCCAPTDLCNTGTDPNNPDTDGDGLSDGDEVYGTLGGLNLPALGANPCHKDIFVEVDWTDDAHDGPFHTHRPTAAAVGLITAAFAAAPVANPDGVNGIALHVDYGQGAPFTGGNFIGGAPAFITFDAGFNGLKAIHFAGNRKGYFHYSIFSHRYNNASNNSSGIAEINADDFMVTLQTFLSDANVSKTMMHELGHNLNLRHGGFENRNYKPNYNSVMNYRFQFPGADGANCDSFGDGILDYSVGARIPLNENALDENAGVCGAVPIDWNASGLIENPVARNINCQAGTTTACGGVNAACYDATCDLLQDYDDWANIVYNNLVGGDRAQIEIITCQDTPEEK